MLRPLLWASLLAGLATAFVAARQPAMQEWPVYGGDPGGTKASPLADVNRDNVSGLAIAWEWRPGDAPLEDFGTRPGNFQNTPLMIDNVLYVSTPYNRVVALDAETGTEKWSYDPRAYADGQPPNGTGFVHRGLAAWRDDGKLRLFLNSRYRLICLDAETGRPVDAFGDHGVVDLSQNLVWPIEKRHYTQTSPPVVYKDIVILGNGVGDRLAYRRDPPGDIRGFDARTGRQLWSFHTIPQRGEFGHETWQEGSTAYTGHTNAWAPMTLDETRGLLYVPVGTPSNDLYGGNRIGEGLFGESLVCLDAATGRRVWHFQLVHHGIWDYDPPSPPNLGDHHAERQARGRRRAADQAGLRLRVRSRDRHARVADRGAGRATERRSRRDRLPTQPVYLRAAGVHRAGRVARRCVRLTPALREQAQQAMRQYRLGPLFTPPSLEGNDHATWQHRRRQLGRRRLRCRAATLREDHQPADDREGAEAGPVGVEPAGR
ncbi:MAG: PQQ-binding-like beta-propeller repeat protein [Vicinamibacterales bacterium]